MTLDEEDLTGKKNEDKLKKMKIIQLGFQMTKIKILGWSENEKKLGWEERKNEPRKFLLWYHVTNLTYDSIDGA